MRFDALLDNVGPEDEHVRRAVATLLEAKVAGMEADVSPRFHALQDFTEYELGRLSDLCRSTERRIDHAAIDRFFREAIQRVGY